MALLAAFSDDIAAIVIKDGDQYASGLRPWHLVIRGIVDVAGL